MKDIPKILHLYWDKSPMSYLCYLTAESFHYHNPDWDIRIYTPIGKPVSTPWNTKEHNIKIQGKNYWPLLCKKPYIDVFEIDISELGFPQQLHGVHQSDIFRWYFLTKSGGVWSDFDILYTKPISSLSLSPSTTSTICYHQNRGDNMATYKIGFIIAKKDNIFYNHIFNACKLRFDWADKWDKLSINNYQFFGVEVFKSGFDTVRDLFKRYPDVENIPLSWVYPTGWQDKVLSPIFYNKKSISLPKNNIGIHWYNGNNIIKNYVNNFESYKNNGSLMSSLIKQHEKNINSNSIS